MRYFVNGYLRNPNHAITVHVVGCGGTGSFVVSRLARINFALKEMEHPGLHVIAFDDDKVEKFNVGRQNFFENDEGEFKSINIIEKVNMAFGTNWNAKTERHDGSIGANIIFSCVDNVEFRKKFYKNGKKSITPNSMYRQGLYLFDCGNGKDFGQVIVSELYGTVLKDTIDIFPDMYKQDNFKIQRTKGCSFREKLQEQDLFINDFISAEACNIFWKMLTQSYIESQGVVINQREFKKQPIKIYEPQV